jgi:membrane protease YdiL (CAAX protease family)
LGAAALSLAGAAVPFKTPLIFLGLACLAAAKFLGVPAGAAQARSASAAPWPAWAQRWVPSFLRVFDAAGGVLDVQSRFEAQVGGGSIAALRVWLTGGLRAAFYTLPVMVFWMFGAALLRLPQIVSQGLHIGQTASGQFILHAPWIPLLARQIASGALLQTALLGGVFAGARAFLTRLNVSAGRVPLYCGALTLAVALPALLAGSYTVVQVLPILGIEAALIWSYARSKSLIVPLAANAMIGLSSLYSAHMVATVQAPMTGSLASLPGIPGFYGVMVVLGVSTGLFALSAAVRFGASRGLGFLKAAIASEWNRLAVVGRWWGTPRADGAPKSLLPVISAASLQGIWVFLSNYIAYFAGYAVFPTPEVIPDVLKKTLLMTLDSQTYIFLIGAALEEWMFRKGLFDWLLGKFSRRGMNSSASFLMAAGLSSVVFSSFHFIDWNAGLAAMHIHVPSAVQALLGVYSFTWAGFLGRVSAGFFLAGIYRRSRSMTVSFLAHFTSNLLEAVGLHWGLPWFLAGVTGIFALQWLGRPRFGRKA